MTDGTGLVYGEGVELNPIYYSKFGNNNMLVAKTDEQQDIEYTKTVVTKSVSSIDDMVYNDFLTMYYTLYIGDTDAFYQSLDNLSKSLSNFEASKVRDQVPIRVNTIRIVPRRL